MPLKRIFHPKKSTDANANTTANNETSLSPSTLSHLSTIVWECIIPFWTCYTLSCYFLTDSVKSSTGRRRKQVVIRKKIKEIQEFLETFEKKVYSFWKKSASNLICGSANTSNCNDDKEEEFGNYASWSSIMLTAAVGYVCFSPFLFMKPPVGYHYYQQDIVSGGHGGKNIHCSAGHSGFSFGAGGWGWFLYYPLFLSLLLDDGSKNDDDTSNDDDDDGRGNKYKDEMEETKKEEKTLGGVTIVETAVESNSEKPQQKQLKDIIQTTATTAINNARSRSESISSTAQPPTSPPQQPQRYLEMLVHNVAHTDLVLSLAPSSSTAMMPTVTPRKTNIKKIEEDDKCLCRPRFSTFDMFSRRVLQTLKQQRQNYDNKENTENTRQQEQLDSILITYPRYERNVFSPRFSIVAPLRSKTSGKLVMLPAGFDLTAFHSSPEKRDEEEDLLKINPQELPSLRVRGRDVPKLGKVCEDMMHHYLFDETNKTHSGSSINTQKEKDEMEGAVPLPSANESNDLYLNAVFFPLMATLLPRWTSQIEEKYKSTTSATPENIKKVVILVSGVGTPRNWTHSITGNSTQALSELMEMFITTLYPDVTVVRIHSDTNIFRYDENISFVKRELMPRIDAYRDAHARGEAYPDEEDRIAVKSGGSRNPFNPDWKQSFAVTLSFADGSPARAHAIQASLRPYRPTYFHFWQLKTFWHESKICDDDIEVHSFEDMETVPAMEVMKTSHTVQLVVNEMIAFRTQVLDTLKRDSSTNDIRQFWLRKTKKPVLAVLLVEKQNDGEGGAGKRILYRGTNMEVSMPTGSLCAERNVIGTALASDPSLKREDLKMVAVLAVQLPPPPSSVGMDGGSSVGTAGGMITPSALPICQPVSGGNISTDAGLRSISAASAPASAAAGHAFLTEVEQKLEQCQQRPEGMRRSMSVTSCASIVECADEDQDQETEEKEEGEVIVTDSSIKNIETDLSSSWVVGECIEGSTLEQQQEEQKKSSSISSSSSNIITVPKSPKFSPALMSKGTPPSIVPTLNLSQVPSLHVATVSSTSPKQPGTPMRTIKLYADDDAGSVAESDLVHVEKGGSNGDGSRVTTGKKPVISKPPTGRRTQKRTVVVHSSSEDLNPLRPCGACNEWLKKIAEVSIDFKVLTFTDANCNGVYVSSCQE